MTAMNDPQPFEIPAEDSTERNGTERAETGPALRGWFNAGETRGHQAAPCLLMIDLPGTHPSGFERIWTDLVSRLNARGVHTAQVSMPGDDTAPLPTQAGNWARSLERTVRWLSEHFPVEPTRIGLLGMRHGAQLLSEERTRHLQLDRAAFLSPRFETYPGSENPPAPEDRSPDGGDAAETNVVSIHAGATFDPEHAASPAETDLSPELSTDILLIAGAAAETEAADELWWMQSKLLAAGWPATHELIAQCDASFSGRQIEMLCEDRLHLFFMPLTRRAARRTR